MTSTQLMLTYKTKSKREVTYKTDNWKKAEETEVRKNVHNDIRTEDLEAKYPDMQQRIANQTSKTNHRDKDADGTAAEDGCRICDKENMRKGKSDICVQCEYSSHGLSCQ